MFCSNCGQPQTDDAAFCGYCGTPFAAEKPEGTVVPIMTREAYFASSATVKKRRRTIKILSVINLIVLGFLCAYSSIVYGIIAYLLSRDGIGYGLFVIPIICLVLTTASFIFTISGIKKHSTGLLFTAIIFVFNSAVLSGGTTINVLPLRWLVIFGTTAISIAVMIQNSKNNKEFKEYLCSNQK